MIETKLKTLMRASVVGQATYILSLALMPCQNAVPTGAVQNADLKSIQGYASDPFNTQLSFVDLNAVTAQQPLSGAALAGSPAQSIMTESLQRTECSKKKTDAGIQSSF